VLKERLPKEVRLNGTCSSGADDDRNDRVLYTSCRDVSTEIFRHVDQNLRGPHVARGSSSYRSIYMLPTPDLGSKPVGRRRCCCGSTRQTDSETVGSDTLDRFMTAQ